MIQYTRKMFLEMIKVKADSNKMWRKAALERGDCKRLYMYIKY